MVDFIHALVVTDGHMACQVLLDEQALSLFLLNNEFAVSLFQHFFNSINSFCAVIGPNFHELLIASPRGITGELFDHRTLVNIHAITFTCTGSKTHQVILCHVSRLVSSLLDQKCIHPTFDCRKKSTSARVSSTNHQHLGVDRIHKVKRINGLHLAERRKII